MKKGIGAALLGAALSMGGGLGTPVTVASQSPVQNQNVRQDKMMPPEVINEVNVVKNRLTGGIRMRRGWGTSPKQYGQWLQMRGRQNWVGRSSRHPVQIYHGAA